MYDNLPRRQYMFKFIPIFLLFVSVSFAKEVTYIVDGKEFEGHVVNKGKGAPTIIVVHDWDGITDYEKKRAEMLSKLGYSVFLVDMYGKGIRPTEIAEKKKMTSSLYKDRKKMRRLMKGAMTAAKKQGLNLGNAVALGYCFGGTSILELARSGVTLKGYASFHGGLAIPENQNYRGVKSKIIIFHGTADTAVTMQEFADLANTLEKNEVAHEMITYSGAPHAFSVFGSDRYRKEADEKSWRRFTQFLQEQFK